MRFVGKEADSLERHSSWDPYRVPNHDERTYISLGK
jgi:hypothetical protein